jgi:hypothetical protein
VRKRQAVALADWVMAHQALAGLAGLAAFMALAFLAATGATVLTGPVTALGVGLLALGLAALHRLLDRYTKGVVNAPRLQGFHEWQVQGRVTAADCEDVERRLRETIEGRRAGDRAVAFAGILLSAGLACAFLALTAWPGRGDDVAEMVAMAVVAAGGAVYLLIVGLPLLRDGMERQRADSEALDAAEKALIAKAAAGTVKATRTLAAPGAEGRKPTVTRVR